MKANELRIGNLVNINEETRIDNTNELPLINPLFKIERIDEDGEIIIYSEINNLHIHCDLESIQPITLIEEWLLKFGFELSPNGKYHILAGKILIDYDVNNKWVDLVKRVNFNTFIHIEYVHQIQNLYFALTGEELTLKQQKQ
jgi:hypothetical protein